LNYTRAGDVILRGRTGWRQMELWKGGFGRSWGRPYTAEFARKKR